MPIICCVGDHKSLMHLAYFSCGILNIASVSKPKLNSWLIQPVGPLFYFFCNLMSSVLLSDSCSDNVFAVDPDPSASAAVAPAGPSSAPGGSRATLCQSTEQHRRSQHLCLGSHSHHAAAPVTAHPDRPCKAQSYMRQGFCKSTKIYTQ